MPFFWSILFYFPLLLCWGRGTLWHLHRFLQCMKCIILEFTPSTIVLYPPMSDWSSMQLIYDRSSLNSGLC
jgi:hypothetical protein